MSTGKLTATVFMAGPEDKLGVVMSMNKSVILLLTAIKNNFTM